MFSAPTRPRTPMKRGLKSMLMDVERLYAARTVTKMPTANMARDSILPTVPDTLKTSRASVPVVSLRIGSLFGI